MISRESEDWETREKRKIERKNAVKKFVLKMGITAAVGVVTGILIAPRSGKKIREDLKKCCDHLKNHQEIRLWKLRIERIE